MDGRTKRNAWLVVRQLGLVGLASVIWLGGARAQNSGADSVEVVRQILRATNLDARLREQYLKQQVDQVRAIPDLRQAIGLQEWRDQETTGAWALVDKTYRGLLCQRFEEEVRSVLQHGDATTKSVVLNMLADQSGVLRDSVKKHGLARKFTPDILALLNQPDAALKRQAARTLGLIYPECERVVPALARMLAAGDPEDRAAAADGLANLIRTAARLTLRTRDLGGIECSRSELVKTGRMATPCAGRGLADVDAEVRRHSAEALCQSAESLRLLVQAFDSGDELEAAEKYREHVAEERTELLPLIDALKEQSPALTRAMGDPDGEVRLSARRALEDMTHPQLRMVSRGISGTGSKDGRFTSTSLKPANFLAPPDLANDPLISGMQGTVAALATGLKDPDAGARRAAIDVLESIGPAAAPAAKALVVALADRDPFVRWAAARTLGKLSPIETELTVPALAKLLDDADYDLKLAALTALERFGPEARRVVPELIAVSISGDADLRMASMRVLASIGGPEAHQAIPTLRAALSGNDQRIQVVAAEALGRFGPAAKEAEPELRAALRSSNSTVQKAAGDALLSVLRSAP
jgi:HEAT repeat protein